MIEIWLNGSVGRAILRMSAQISVVLPVRGHNKLESTVGYLGIEVDDALELAEQMDI